LLVHQNAADVLAVQQVLVALVDLVKPVPIGHQFVELEMAGTVQVEHPRYVAERVAATEQRAWIRFSNSVSSKPETWMVFSAGPASPVTITVPCLCVAANAALMTCPVPESGTGA
jgi:hypothetical protein